MAKRLNFTDDEKTRTDREVDAFLMFIEDVFADPSLVDGMPDEASVEAIPIAERKAGRHYDVETPRTVVNLTPVSQGASAS